MQQRAEPHDSLDFFPTPPWATRALCEWLAKRVVAYRTAIDQSVWEPACGDGHMARPLGEYFSKVIASDVHPYGYGELLDFLFPFSDESPAPDWIITNPPFRLGKEFALKALGLARIGVALLVRTAFLEGGERHRELFAPHLPFAILQFCERVPMVKGRYDPLASTATSYCWIVWLTHATRPPGTASTAFDWLPPCRARLERDVDREFAVSVP
jgi:hypothetical protein